MRNSRMLEHGKNRVSQIKAEDIYNRAVIGIFALWSVWATTSLIIKFMQ